MRVLSPCRNNNLLFLLVITDLSFFFLNILLKAGFITSALFSIQTDLGLAEIFQYLKEYWIVCILIVLGYRRSALIYVAWAFLFTYLLLDDSLQIHENLGMELTRFLESKTAFGLASQDIGELIVSALFGGLFFILIGVVFLKAKKADRVVSKSLFYMVVILAFFGAGRLLGLFAVGIFGRAIVLLIVYIAVFKFYKKIVCLTTTYQN